MKIIKKITLAVVALLTAATLFTSCNKIGDYWFIIGSEFYSKVPTKYAEYNEIVKRYYDLKDSDLKFSNMSESEATKAAIAIFDQMTAELDQVSIMWEKGEYFNVTLVMDYPKLKLIKQKGYVSDAK